MDQMETQFHLNDTQSAVYMDGILGETQPSEVPVERPLLHRTSGEPPKDAAEVKDPESPEEKPVGQRSPPLKVENPEVKDIKDGSHVEVLPEVSPVKVWYLKKNMVYSKHVLKLFSQQVLPFNCLKKIGNWCSMFLKGTNCIERYAASNGGECPAGSSCKGCNEETFGKGFA